MFRKTTAGALFIIFVMFIMMFMPLLSIGVSAEPYKEINIAADKISYIDAVHFDTEPYYESNPAEVQHGTRVHEVQTEAGSSGFEGNIGYTEAGEWVQYTVNVEADGKYKFELYAASGSEGEFPIEISYSNDTVDTVIGVTQPVANLGGDTPWQEYGWYEAGETDMTAGVQVLKVLFVNGGVNLAAVRVTPANMPESVTETETQTETAAPETTTPVAATEAPSAAEEAETSTVSPASPASANDDGDMILWIAVAAAAVVIIVVIIVIATKKKK